MTRRQARELREIIAGTALILASISAVVVFFAAHGAFA